jgi:hypothetical protein
MVETIAITKIRCHIVSGASISLKQSSERTPKTLYQLEYPVRPKRVVPAVVPALRGADPTQRLRPLVPPPGAPVNDGLGSGLHVGAPELPGHF